MRLRSCDDFGSRIFHYQSELLIPRRYVGEHLICNQEIRMLGESVVVVVLHLR